jgi:signal transduction histidine kinase/ligand-binding sensor domain-containing protein
LCPQKRVDLRRNVALLLGLLLVKLSLFAQPVVPLHFESFTINDGLSQGFISAILQDKKGFMWFATNDGLNKYDGYSFKVLHHEPGNTNSPGGDDVTCLFEDKQQRLWIGFRGKGIDIYDQEYNTFRHIRHKGPNSLRSDFVLSITEDKSGVFWIRTVDGIDRLEIKGDSMLFTPIRLDSSLQLRRTGGGAESFLTDSRNRKFITASNCVLEVFFNEQTHTYRMTERFRFHNSLPYFTAALMEDTLNHCFYLNNGQVIKFPDYNFSVPRYMAVYDAKNIRWSLDKSHQLWLLGRGYINLVHTRSKKQRRIVPDDTRQLQIMETASVFYTDRTGVVWIGTGGYGLIKYDPATAGFHHIMKNANIYQLKEDEHGRIITNNLNALEIGEDSVRYQPDFIQDPLIASRFNITFTRDTARKLWFVGDDGIIRYDPGSRRSQSFRIPFAGLKSMPFPLFADRATSIWMGYNGQLVRYDWANNRFSNYDYPAGYMQYDFDFLQSIYEDDDGLWLGSANGLFLFDVKREKMIRVFANDEKDTTSIASNAVFSFCADVNEPERYLWIGTKGGGLNRLDKHTGKFRRFGSRTGLPSNVVYGILPDYSGNLWLSTNKGLSVFNIATETCRNFDVSDGLQSDEFNRYAYLRTSEGIMVFGGLNGINYFRSDELKPLDPPKVVFTDLRLFNRPVEPGMPGSPLAKTISTTSSIVLRYRQNVVTFRFAAMDYRKKGSIRYRYKMEGFDRDWIYSGNDNEATYTNLDPDNYRFIVQASFENGEWSSDSASLHLKIITPWHRSWWFYLLVTMTISSLIYALYRFRLYQLTRMERLRNRIARDLHDEVGSSVSTIAIYSRIVQDQMDNQSFDSKPLLAKINDFATEILDSMNDIVWNINTRNDAFEHIISRMREHATHLLEARGHQLHFSFDEHILQSKLDMERRREFYLIYKEALNNVVKYAEAQNVWISLLLSGNLITLKIRDDGKGFDPDTVKKKGNGLSNMQHRANLLHGKFTILSAVGTGTEIMLTITVSMQLHKLR